jgi:hypothetical protein
MSNVTQSASTMNLLDDPIFYIYIVGIFLFTPSFLSQAMLLIQIWKHRLTDDLSANLIINIAAWALLLFLGLLSGRF